MARRPQPALCFSKFEELDRGTVFDDKCNPHTIGRRVRLNNDFLPFNLRRQIIYLEGNVRHVRTRSGTDASGSKRIHSIPYALVSYPDTYVAYPSMSLSPSRRSVVGIPIWWYRRIGLHSIAADSCRVVKSTISLTDPVLPVLDNIRHVAERCTSRTTSNIGRDGHS